MLPSQFVIQVGRELVLHRAAHRARRPIAGGTGGGGRSGDLANRSPGPGPHLRRAGSGHLDRLRGQRAAVLRPGRAGVCRDPLVRRPTAPGAAGAFPPGADSRAWGPGCLSASPTGRWGSRGDDLPKAVGEGGQQRQRISWWMTRCTPSPERLRKCSSTSTTPSLRPASSRSRPCSARPAAGRARPPTSDEPSGVGRSCWATTRFLALALVLVLRRDACAARRRMGRVRFTWPRARPAARPRDRAGVLPGRMAAWGVGVLASARAELLVMCRWPTMWAFVLIMPVVMLFDGYIAWACPA